MKRKINEMHLEVMSHPENIGLCRLAAATFASGLPFTVAEIEEVKVAVSEAVSNCIVHAYRDGQGPISMHLEWLDNDELIIEVRDHGTGIVDLEQARQPSYSTDPERMGLGFVFMESFMDEMRVETAVGEGTTIWMRKRAGEQPFRTGNELHGTSLDR